MQQDPTGNVCREWLAGRCYEFKWDSEKHEYFCGSHGVRRLHTNTRNDWQPDVPTAFSFVMSASDRICKMIAAYGRDQPPQRVPQWRVACLADGRLTIAKQLLVFADRRLVCAQQLMLFVSLVRRMRL